MLFRSWATIIQNYTRPGSNWRLSACEADVIATRPRVLVTICQGVLILFGEHFFLSEGMSLCFWAFRRAFFFARRGLVGQRARDRDPKAKCAQGSGTRSPGTIGKMRFPKSQPSPPTFIPPGHWMGRATGIHDWHTAAFVLKLTRINSKHPWSSGYDVSLTR